MSRRLANMLLSMPPVACRAASRSALPAATQLPCLHAASHSTAAGRYASQRPGSQQLLCLRTFASSHADQPLLDVLAGEAEHETSTYEKPDIKLPRDWTLADPSDESLLRLSRSLNGEEITVQTDVNSIGDEAEELPEVEDGEEVPEQDSMLIFEVGVTKGSQKLAFECRYTAPPYEGEGEGEPYVEILHVGLEPVELDAAKEYYEGPVFAELDEKLQTEWDEYLAARGVTPELGATLLSLAEDKEQRQYMTWLEDVQAFVKK